MRVEPTEDFEGPALEWLFREAQRLVEVLARRGLGPDDVRPIVEEFISGMCVDLDQEPLTSEGCTYTPGLHFTSADQMLVADHETFAWHDYALGVVGEIFEDS